MMRRRTLLLGAIAGAAAAPSLAWAQAPDFAAAAQYSAERRGVSLLVMQRGRVLYEDYPNAGGADRGWELASGTKSFTGLMLAAAVQDELMEIDERVADTITEWRADPIKSRITIRHLLNLTCGLYMPPGQRPPTYAQALETPAGAEPGERFQYGPAPFQIFGELLRRKITPRDRDPVAYIQRRIFDPLNIAPTTWRRGADRMPHMPQGAHFTARAWATFGQMVLEGGRGLVDQRALRECFEGTRANPGYGLSWWLLRPGLRPPTPRSGVRLPEGSEFEDVRMAAGAGDQRLYILPRRDAIIVRQANQILRGMRARGDARWNDAEFLQFFEAL